LYEIFFLRFVIHFEQGELLFPSWKSIFESGGTIPKKAAIYSFNGKNVLTSSAW